MVDSFHGFGATICVLYGVSIGIFFQNLKSVFISYKETHGQYLEMNYYIIYL